MTDFSKDWVNWINENIDAGKDKDGIFKILLDEGYSIDQIKKQMDYEPSTPLENIVNPLKLENLVQPNIGLENGISKNELMPINLHIPKAKKLKSNLAEFYIIKEFLDEKECEKVIALIKENLRPSTMVDNGSKENSFRTSKTCDLGQLNDPLVNMIDSRICKVMGIDSTFSEPIQGQMYEVGQEFKAHTDYFESTELPSQDNGYGQRTYTFFIYLNDVEEGGHTDFPKLGLAGKPQRGNALIWNNLNPDGTTNHNTMHHGMPVIKGWKAVITKWFRIKSPLKSIDQRMIKTNNEKLPNFTDKGFTKATLDKSLHSKILNFYNANRELQKDEFVEGEFIVNTDENNSINKRVPSTLIDLPKNLKQEIHDYLKARMEEWSGVQLEPTFVYGVRTYNDKAKLKIHRDRLDTHIISCIINIYQDVNEDWPLQIDDHLYRQHNVILKPGEIVFYEGAKLNHGREIPLNGRAYANVFCHFRPQNVKRRT